MAQHKRLISIMLALPSLISAVGCAALTPYEEVASKREAGTLVSVSGQRVHVIDEGQGPAVLLLHGFASSTFSFSELIPRLSDTHRVIAVDLNGFGYTERLPDSDAYLPQSQVRTLLELLDQLEIEEVALVGHSYGALLALFLAGESPTRVSHLVLISPPASPERPPWLLRGRVGRWAAYGMTRLLLSQPDRSRQTLSRAYHREGMPSAETAEAYRERLLIEGLPWAFQGYLEAMAAAEDLDAISEPPESAPLTILAGAEDRIVSMEACRQLATRLSAPLIVFPAVGHSLPEEDPDRLAETLLALLHEKPLDADRQDKAMDQRPSPMTEGHR